MNTGSNVKPVRLISPNGTEIRRTAIHCAADYPRLIEWNDPSPDGGTRHFIHIDGGTYMEEWSFLLSLGEARDGG